MPAVIHLVSLQAAAGVELQFAEFVANAAVRAPEWSHVLMNPSGPVHPLVRRTLGSALAAEFRTKYWGSVRLPAVPAVLRAQHARRRIRQHDARLLLSWNRTSRIRFAVDAAGAMPVVHYEHGAAWFGGQAADRNRYFRRVASCIAVSRAAARVVKAYWGYEGPVSVCRNALRPSLQPHGDAARRLPSGRPIRIGVVARLVPVKGVPVALHTLRLVRQAGVDAELRIAGEGPERDRLQQLARHLGLESVVRFCGAIVDMSSFYGGIDCLLHTPLSEAFGLVALEAAAHGCPVVAAAVDGLPEVVEDGTSGTCLPLDLPLAEYVALGGTTSGLPDIVYDPHTDRLIEPRIVDPATAASEIVRLFSDRVVYEGLSRTAARQVAEAFSFGRYVDQLMHAIRSITAS